MGAAFEIAEKRPDLSILMMDQEKFSTGGMRNDCKMNFTYPIGFPEEYWTKDQANRYMERVTRFLTPEFMDKSNIAIYQQRAKRLGCRLLEIQQSHLGTDGGLRLIKRLLAELNSHGVNLALGETMLSVDDKKRVISTDKRDIEYRKLLIAPGRRGFHFLQMVMQSLGVPFVDNIVDIGVRVETRLEHYPIVKDYYDPKFYFPEKVRTFCTNSGDAHVVKEKYVSARGGYLVLGEWACLFRGYTRGKRTGELRDTEDGEIHSPIGEWPDLCRESRYAGGPYGWRQTPYAACWRFSTRIPQQGKQLQCGSLRFPTELAGVLSGRYLISNTGQDPSGNLEGDEEPRYDSARGASPLNHHVLPGNKTLCEQTGFPGPLLPSYRFRVLGR